MSELSVGIISNAELAEWFGLKARSFGSMKKKKLEELKEFARFELKGTKVNILEVYQKEYIKKRSYNYQVIKEEFCQVWDKSGLDTCSSVSKKIQKRRKDMNVLDDTAYRYTREVRNELYGKPFISKGTKGRCQYVWCKKTGDSSYERFSADEQKIYEELKVKYFKGTDEKTMFVQNMIDKGEITSEEAWAVYEEMANIKGNFMLFKAELEAALKCQIVRGTVIENTIEWEG